MAMPRDTTRALDAGRAEGLGRGLRLGPSARARTDRLSSKPSYTRIDSSPRGLYSDPLSSVMLRYPLPGARTCRTNPSSRFSL